MANIIVGVTASISAYKAIDFVNGLVKTGNKVKVIMTNNSMQFVSQLNFFNAEVTHIDSDEWIDQSVLHIKLAKWADAFVVYPTTANTISKLVYGLADNLLTSTWLACTAPKIVFPAMNTEMLKNKTTRSNMDALNMMKGVTVTTTEEGVLACGDKGAGKLIKPRNAVVLVNQRINFDPYAKTIIVTAGGTRAPIDGVRVVTNISSGALGAHIIDEFLENSGYNIIHVAPKMSVRSPLSGIFPHRYRFIRADTVEDVYETLSEEVPSADAVIHSMAISDFTFDIDEAIKIKSNDAKGFIESISKSIKKSPKLIKKIKEENPDTFLVGFKFEVGITTKELIDLAWKQIDECGSDLVLINDKEEMMKAGKHIAKLIGGDDDISDELSGKKEIAKEIRKRTVEAVGK